MRDLLLHIGRHKSGTTAIQQFLNSNRKPLQAAGYYVPRSGRIGAGHHQLSRPLQRGEVRNSDLPEPATLPAYRRLLQELEDVDPALTVVLSSEAFQNCDPALVAGAFPDFRIRIAVYLRHQLDYLASAYAQRVHATAYAESLETFYRNIYLSAADYEQFLSAWEGVFPSGFRVRRYRPADVVEDFRREILGLGDGTWTAPPERNNPSLNARVVVFKRWLNTLERCGKPGKDILYALLPRLNDAFPAPPVTVPDDLRDDLLSRCEHSDAVVAQRYFGEPCLFSYAAYRGAPLPALDTDELEAMYATLQDLCSGINP